MSIRSRTTSTDSSAVSAALRVVRLGDAFGDSTAHRWSNTPSLADLTEHHHRERTTSEGFASLLTNDGEERGALPPEAMALGFRPASETRHASDATFSGSLVAFCEPEGAGRNERSTVEPLPQLRELKLQSRSSSSLLVRPALMGAGSEANQ